MITLPEECPSDEVTVPDYTGVGLFAEVARIDEEWPRPAGSASAVVVLSMRMLPQVPSPVASRRCGDGRANWRATVGA